VRVATSFAPPVGASGDPIDPELVFQVKNIPASFRVQTVLTSINGVLTKTPFARAPRRTGTRPPTINCTTTWTARPKELANGIKTLCPGTWTSPIAISASPNRERSSMKAGDARIWLIRSSLILVGAEFASFVLAPVLGYPLRVPTVDPAYGDLNPRLRRLSRVPRHTRCSAVQGTTCRGSSSRAKPPCWSRADRGVLIRRHRRARRLRCLEWPTVSGLIPRQRR